MRCLSWEELEAKAYQFEVGAAKVLQSLDSLLEAAYEWLQSFPGIKALAKIVTKINV